ncbi:MAG: hypothetical protein JRH11_08125 [Deltaproteobacteria bacterium]|nr:hypothetical protein [Deltaproteobacteria bacterium]
MRFVISPFLVVLALALAPSSVAAQLSVGPEIFLGDDTPRPANYIKTPEIAFNGSQFLLVWIEAPNSLRPSHLMASRIMTDGTARDPEGLRLATTTSVFVEPFGDMRVTGGSGGFIVRSSSGTQHVADDGTITPVTGLGAGALVGHGAGYLVFEPSGARRLDASGATVASYPLPRGFMPSAAVANGDVILLYDDTFVLRVDALTVTALDADTIALGGTSPVAVDIGASGFVLAWGENTIEAAIIPTSGPVGAPITLVADRTTLLSDPPRLSGAEGEALLVYTDWDADAPTPADTVLGVRLLGDGTVLDSAPVALETRALGAVGTAAAGTSTAHTIATAGRLGADSHQSLLRLPVGGASTPLTSLPLRAASHDVAVVAAGDGAFAVTWGEDRGGMQTRRDAMLQRFAPDGASIDSDPLVLEATPLDEGYGVFTVFDGSVFRSFWESSPNGLAPGDTPTEFHATSFDGRGTISPATDLMVDGGLGFRAAVVGDRTLLSWVTIDGTRGQINAAWVAGDWTISADRFDLSGLIVEAVTDDVQAYLSAWPLRDGELLEASLDIGTTNPVSSHVVALAQRDGRVLALMHEPSMGTVAFAPGAAINLVAAEEDPPPVVRSPTGMALVHDGSSFVAFWTSGTDAAAAIMAMRLRADGVPLDPAPTQVVAADGALELETTGAASLGNGRTLLVFNRGDVFLGRNSMIWIESELSPQGTSCDGDAECGSGYCVDGVCCESACRRDDADRCAVCAAALGASADGLCEAAPGSMCIPDAGTDAGTDAAPGDAGPDGSVGGPGGGGGGCSASSPTGSAAFFGLLVLLFVARRWSSHPS